MHLQAASASCALHSQSSADAQQQLQSSAEVKLAGSGALHVLAGHERGLLGALFVADVHLPLQLSGFLRKKPEICRG